MTGGRNFAWWLAAPGAIASVGALFWGLAAGGGLALSAILALTAVAIWFAARALWDRVSPETRLGGAGIGMLAGVAAASVSYGAFALDARIGPSLGGSMTQVFFDGSMSQGVQEGVKAAQPGGPANVLTAPVALVTVPAGVIAGAAIAVLTLLSVCALPILTGVVGGALSARRRHGSA